VLDVGCGMGRFADVILRWGGEDYAVDLSFAVDAAYANLGDRPGFHVAQASVFDLPFRPKTFDLIFSLGVLDTRRLRARVQGAAAASQARRQNCDLGLFDPHVSSRQRRREA